jgi:vesicle coat complex subunit
MTNREFFTAVAALENIPADLKEHAEAAIVKMDETNAKRKEKAKETDASAKWAEENAEVIENAFAALGTETKVAADIAAAVGTSTQKINHVMRYLVDQGRVIAGETKLPKKGTVKTYTAVIAD